MIEIDKDIWLILSVVAIIALGIVLPLLFALPKEPANPETAQETAPATTDETHETAGETEAVALRQGATYEQARAWLAIGLMCMAVALTLWGYIDRNHTASWDYMDSAVKVKLVVAWTLFGISAVMAIPLIIGYGYKVLSYVK